MNEDKLVSALAEDKCQQCEDKYMITNTGFLDMRQQTLCTKIVQRRAYAKGFFYGGYEEAERRLAVFLPDYIELGDKTELHQYFLDNPEDCPLSVIRARHNGYKELSHRDYLGSLMGLGLKREAVGDILVTQGGADILILRELSDFIMTEYGKAGRTYLTIEEAELKDLVQPEIKIVNRSQTVASLRLDNVIAAAFGISRSKALEAIKAGIVFVNSMQCEKPEKQIEEGERLVIRGKGKIIVQEIGGNTRKDRIFINFGIIR